MTVSHYIVGIVGVGYLTVGIEQYIRGNTGPAIMWIGYAFSQIGLFMGLAK
jgi:hypothetical protein